MHAGRQLLYAGARVKELLLTLLHLAVVTAKLGTDAKAGHTAGPGFGCPSDEKSRRYFRLVSARCRLKSVVGFTTIAERRSRRGRMRSAQKPTMMRSERRRRGDRFPRTIEDQQLLLDEHGFCDHGTGAAETGQPGGGRQQMEKQDGQITHERS